LSFAASVLGPGHIEVVAQDREQAAVGFCLNAIFFSVYLKLQSLHETPLEMGWQPDLKVITCVIELARLVRLGIRAPVSSYHHLIAPRKPS
jgi:hypothetical protein